MCVCACACACACVCACVRGGGRIVCMCVRGSNVHLCVCNAVHYRSELTPTKGNNVIWPSVLLIHPDILPHFRTQNCLSAL